MSDHKTLVSLLVKDRSRTSNILTPQTATSPVGASPIRNTHRGVPSLTSSVSEPNDLDNKENSDDETGNNAGSGEY
jgi:hypothetical protein